MRFLLLFIGVFSFVHWYSIGQTRYKVGLCVTATSKYNSLLSQFITSAERHFLKNHDVTFFVFSDQPVSPSPNVVWIRVEHKPWPLATLLRFENYFAAQDILSKMDYIFASDVDMEFANEVPDFILSYRVATSHVGFLHNKRHLYTYETNPQSTACIAPHEGALYFAGGFYGGAAKEFITLTAITSEKIKTDLEKNYIAIWHDESHLNRYFVDYPPTLILPASFCYAPQFLTVPMKPILKCLDKNHAFMRS